MTNEQKKQHNWSGWPGAYCLKCGVEDMEEVAIADNVLDPYTGEWTTEEEKQKYRQKECR